MRHNNTPQWMRAKAHRRKKEVGLTSGGAGGDSFRGCLALFFFFAPLAPPLPPGPPPFSMKLSSSSTERSSFSRASSGVRLGAPLSAMSFCSSSRLRCSSWRCHKWENLHTFPDFQLLYLSVRSC